MTQSPGSRIGLDDGEHAFKDILGEKFAYQHMVQSHQLQWERKAPQVLCDWDCSQVCPLTAGYEGLNFGKKGPREKA